MIEFELQKEIVRLKAEAMEARQAVARMKEVIGEAKQGLYGEIISQAFHTADSIDKAGT